MLLKSIRIDDTLRAPSLQDIYDDLRRLRSHPYYARKLTYPLVQFLG
jgi:hypothetical protein